MENRKKTFIKKIFLDLFAFIKTPKLFLEKLLTDYQQDFVDKKTIAFIVFMHLYYLFNPVVLFSLNIIALIFSFLSIGILYYISQLCLEQYQNRISQTNYDPKKLYVFAYAFALAECIGLVFSLIIFVFNLNSLLSAIGLVLAFLMTLPVAILVLILKLSIFKIAVPDQFSVVTLFKILIEAIVETFSQNFAVNAWREILADFKAREI